MPWLLETLLRNLDFDLEQLADVMDPILTARNFCQGSGLYLQGIVVGDRCFMASNLNPQGWIQATPCGTHWLLGGHSCCALAIAGQGVAQFHAVLDFDPRHGFLLTTLGEKPGTWVNGQSLKPDQPWLLQEGDTVQVGRLSFEFLQEFCPAYHWN